MADLSFYLVSVLTVILAYFIYKCLPAIQTYRKWLKLSDKVAHLDFHWFWGTLHHVSNTKEFFAINQQLFDAGNKIILYWIGPARPVIGTGDPETVKIILKTSEPKAGGLAGYALLKPWLGDGLLISDGKKWERNRKLLTYAFHFEILQPYVSVYNNCAQTLLNKLEEGCKDGEFIEVFQPVSLATLDTMLKCAFSYDANIQEMGMNNEYVNAVNRISKLILERAFHPILYLTPVYKLTSNGREFFRLCDTMHRFSDDIIQKRKRELEKESNKEDIKKKRYLDFLDILLTARDENGRSLTDLEIRDEADTFLFEGHDTTASAISWCLYALAKYPDVQKKVYEDVKQVLDVSLDLKWADLAKFKYLPLFIKEAMRYFSPVPNISRELTQPLVFDGVEIPKGFTVDINISNMHQNPNVWTNPKKFKPERFEFEAINAKDPYCHVPFSAGPRNCIGQNFAMNEIKTVISRIVYKFEIEYDEDRIPVTIPELVTRAEEGLYLRFTPRF